MGVIFGGLSIALGVLTYSKKTMMTVGKSIVPLDPFSALIAVLSEAMVLHVFTQIGIPVSSSQAVVGGVLGVGIARDFRTVNFHVVARVIGAWVGTPVISGFLAWAGVTLWHFF
ncbi:MAG: inorganic phosphate transporter [Thermodesulforhabdaceae bacterium]